MSFVEQYGHLNPSLSPFWRYLECFLAYLGIWWLQNGVILTIQIYFILLQSHTEDEVFITKNKLQQ